MYFLDVNGELSLHSTPSIPITKEKIKKYWGMFNELILQLVDRGWTYIDTWALEGDPLSIRWSEYFGFVPTGDIKIVQLNGQEFRMIVMRYQIPKLEGTRD